MTSLTALLAAICEQEPPQAVLDGLPSDDAILRLIELGALVPVGVRESITCFACDQPHEALVELLGGGEYSCFCAEAGELPVEARLLQRYGVSMPWVAAQLSLGLGTSTTASQLTLPVPTLLRLGEFRFQHTRCLLFVGRRLFVRQVWEVAQTEVHRLQGELPAIIVTTTPMSHLPSAPRGRIGGAHLDDVLTLGDGLAVVREDPFVSLLQGQLEHMSQDGLGLRPALGHRSVTWRDKSFEFTPLQAKIVELLDVVSRTPERRVNQSAIQERFGTPQRVAQIFRHHKAYGTMIRHDGRGNYWLDREGSG